MIDLLYASFKAVLCLYWLRERRLLNSRKSGILTNDLQNLHVVFDVISGSIYNLVRHHKTTVSDRYYRASTPVLKSCKVQKCFGARARRTGRTFKRRRGLVFQLTSSTLTPLSSTVGSIASLRLNSMSTLHIFYPMKGPIAEESHTRPSKMCSRRISHQSYLKVSG